MKIIDNYADLPVGKYLDILAANEGDADDLDKQVATIAILCDVTEADILNLPLPDYTALARAADFLHHEDKGDHRLAKRYTLGGLALVPCTDSRKMTTAQYIDFQTMTRDGDYDRHLPEILSCFLVPEGHTYGDGYDFADVQDAIRRHLSVTDALSLLAFFFVSLRKLTDASLTLSERATHLVKDKTMRRAMRQKIRETRKAMKEGATPSTPAGAGSQP